MSFTVVESYTTFTCWSCRGLSGVEIGAYNTTKRDGKHLHCVLCGVKNWWPDATAEKQLAAERAAHDQTKAALRDQQELRRATERRLSAKKGVLTKLKGRIAKGMCPCCRRHFGNLWRHMKTQHPDYQQVEE